MAGKEARKKYTHSNNRHNTHSVAAPKRRILGCREDSLRAGKQSGEAGVYVCVCAGLCEVCCGGRSLCPSLARPSALPQQMAAVEINSEKNEVPLPSGGT